jgi:hypothetical protein
MRFPALCFARDILFPARILLSALSWGLHSSILATCLCSGTEIFWSPAFPAAARRTDLVVPARSFIFVQECRAHRQVLGSLDSLFVFVSGFTCPCEDSLVHQISCAPFILPLPWAGRAEATIDSRVRVLAGLEFLLKDPSSHAPVSTMQDLVLNLHFGLLWICSVLARVLALGLCVSRFHFPALISPAWTTAGQISFSCGKELRSAASGLISVSRSLLGSLSPISWIRSPTRFAHAVIQVSFVVRFLLRFGASWSWTGGVQRNAREVVKNLVGLVNVFDLLFDLTVSLVLSLFCTADFGCHSIARLWFACTDCASISILVSISVLRANSFLIAMWSWSC